MAKSEAAEIENATKEKPQDAYMIVYIVFFLVGLVHILPWTFFITAHDYWMHKFRDTSFEDVDSTHRTMLQTEFSPCLTISLQVSTIAFLMLTLFFGKKYSLKLKMFGTLCVELIALIVGALFIHIDTDSWQEGFFALTMITVAVINAMGAIFAMAAYSVLPNFSREYLGAFLNGEGMAKIFTSCLQLFSLAIGISTYSSALVYFWIAIAIVAISIILMILVAKYNAFFRFSMRNPQEIKKEKPFLSFREIITMLKTIWPGPAIMGFYLLTVDSVHTCITSLVVSEGEGNGTWNDVYFVSTITFVLPAFLEYIGRLAALKLKIDIDGKWLVVSSAVRMFVFVPLLMLCNAQPRKHLPVVFPHDYQYITIMTFFSLTNGYFASMSNLVIPKLVAPDKLEDAFHVNAVTSGVLLGAFSFISFVTVDII